MTTTDRLAYVLGTFFGAGLWPWGPGTAGSAAALLLYLVLRPALSGWWLLASAALLYLPRLFVYHSAAAVGDLVSEQFKVMERRLARGIMLPAAVCTWVFGTWIAALGGYFSTLETWFLVKLVLVVSLSLLHFRLDQYVVMFGNDFRPASQVYFRVINEVPTVILIVVTILVVVRPF